MIFICAGPLSPHLLFVARLLSAILERIHGAVDTITANDVEELRAALRERKSQVMVLVTTSPSEVIATSILRNRLSILLVTQDFATVACQSMRTMGAHFVGALREVTRQVSALSPIASSEAAARLPIAEHDTVNSIATRLTLMLGLSLDDDQLETACNALSPATRVSTVIEAERLSIERGDETYVSREILLPHELGLLMRLEESYGQLLTGKRFSPIEIPTEMLIRAEPPQPHLEGPIELLGPSRILTFGPYMHLPVGRWRAELCFDVRDNYSGNEFAMDVFSDNNVLAFAKASMPREGAFQAELEFEITRADAAFEVRTFVYVGAIEGLLTIESLKMVPLNDRSH
ncbi:hypothetical protein N182_32860 [Sinorhizobium sp. GL2]|nr:hypothetical protein N182_32860 [Sinorhizobium sp. GL2]